MLPACVVENGMRCPNPACRRVVKKSLTRHIAHKQDCKQWYHAQFNSEQQVKDECHKFKAKLRKQVCSDLSDLRHDDLVSDAVVARFKAKIERWVALVLDDFEGFMEHRAGGALDREDLQAALATRFDFFDGLRTQKQEMRVLKSFVPVLEPVRRPICPAGGSNCYTFKISEWIGLLMKYDPIVREHVLKSSELWKTGVKKKKPTVIRDFSDAQNFRESRMADPAITDKEKRQLRVALIVSYDDLELVRATHEPFPTRRPSRHPSLHPPRHPSRRPSRRPLRRLAPCVAPHVAPHVAPRVPPRAGACGVGAIQGQAQFGQFLCGDRQPAARATVGARQHAPADDAAREAAEAARCSCRCCWRRQARAIGEQRRTCAWCSDEGDEHRAGHELPRAGKLLPRTPSSLLSFHPSSHPLSPPSSPHSPPPSQTAPSRRSPLAPHRWPLGRCPLAWRCSSTTWCPRSAFCRATIQRLAS